MMQCQQLVASLKAAQVAALTGLGEPGWAVVAGMV